MMTYRKISAAVVLACLLSPVRADVTMPALFGDHMVLQQEATLPVWGTADAGEKVTVMVGAASASTTADADGKWMVKLPELPAGSSPLTVTIRGKNTLTFTDVLVGDVWVCSGQSNMEFPLAMSHEATRDIPKADDPQLRLFCFHHQTALQPLFGFTGPNPSDFVFSNSMPLPDFSSWVLCTPETAKNFTAAGYFFGRELRSHLQRPIGLIKSSWGGTRAEAWTSVEGLKKEPALEHYVEAWQKNVAEQPKLLPGYADRLATYQAGRKKLLSEEMPPYNAAMKEWTVACNAAKAAGQPLPTKPVHPFEEPEPKDPNGGKNGPANLFNGMIAPLIPYTIKGVVWYQGESNAADGMEYRTLFARMIADWREHWGEGDFPFIYVQVASYDAGPQTNWAFLRESQLKTLAVPHTAMASAVDLGDFYSPRNIHPIEKHDVGLRLALAAEHLVYGDKIVASGPLYDSFKVEGNAIRVNFTETGSGLMIGRPPWIALKTVQPWATDKLVGFEVAGADGIYAAADAKIDGNSVLVSSAQVTAPVYVRMAWSNMVWANLYNKEGLPAAPFRTDNFPPPVPPSTHPVAEPNPTAP